MKLLGGLGLIIVVIVVLAYAFGSLGGIELVIAIGVIFPIVYIFGAILLGKPKEEPIDDETKNNRFDKYN